MKVYKRHNSIKITFFIAAIFIVMEIFYSIYILNNYELEQISVADAYIWNQKNFFFLNYISLIQLILLYYLLKQNFNVNNCIRYVKWEKIWIGNMIHNLYISLKLSLMLVVTIFIVFYMRATTFINFGEKNSIFSISTYGGIIQNDKGIFKEILFYFFLISLIKLFFTGTCYIISYWLTERNVFSFIFAYGFQYIVFQNNIIHMDIDYMSWYRNKEHIHYYGIIFLIVILFCGYKICHRKELLNAKNKHN